MIEPMNSGEIKDERYCFPDTPGEDLGGLQES
jgi:hypothetical protein